MPLAPAHHDGSARFVDQMAPALGDTVRLRVTTRADLAARRVVVRVLVDGEPHWLECRAVQPCDGLADEQWWQAELEMTNRVLSYRFLVDAPGRALVLNQRGVHHRDVPDRDDFRLTCDPPLPAWAADAVFYQVFPDRFARGAGEPYPDPLPDWAVAVDWDTPVAHDTPDGVRQYYGGTLTGLAEHLDHLADLGVDAVYLTPFFPAQSNHRYDSTTFGGVDPLLGGDQALRHLTAAAAERGIRVVGDLTLNHTGVGHEWFRRAQDDPTSTEHGFYLFEPGEPGYATFWDAASLPKLDHRDAELRRRLYDGADSVVARYLTDFGLAGWRIDVAEAAGAYRDSDLRLEVARLTRRTMDRAAPGSYLVAENQHDATDSLQGDGWHGAMAYAAFTRPVWSWLAGDVNAQWNSPVPLGRLEGGDMAAQMDDFNAQLPWRSRVGSWNLLGSHDTARIRTAVGRDGQLLAAALLFTLPGIPMVFSGDEYGVEGVGLEDSRRPFPWRAARDAQTFQAYRELIALRRAQPALGHGGFRWVDVQPDAVVFERATATERLLVQVARGEHRAVASPWPLEPLLGSATVAAGEQLPGGPGYRVWRVAGTPGAPVNEWAAARR